MGAWMPATIPGSSPGTGMTSLNIRRLASVLWPITTDRTLTANRRFRGTPEVRGPMPTAGVDANDPSETFGVQCGNGFAIQSMVIRTVARPAISMQD